MIINILLRSLNIYFCLHFLVVHVIFVPPPTQNINGFQLAMYLTKKITPPPPPSPIPHIKNPDIIFFLYDNFRKWRSYCHISPAVWYQRASQYVSWNCQINWRRSHFIWKLEKYSYEIVTNTRTMTLHKVINNYHQNIKM